MKMRVVLLNEKHEHIFDEVVDTKDPKLVDANGTFALMPKDPFLCGGVVIDPNPEMS